MNRSLPSITTLLVLVACAPPTPQQIAHTAPVKVAASTASPSTPVSASSALHTAAVQTPFPRASVSVAPRLTTTPAHAAIPQAVATQSAQTQATQAPQAVNTPSQIVMLPPDASPEILSYELQPSSVQAGETVTGSVTASSNVASVEVRIATYSINMTKTDIGHFTLAYVVPSIPAAWRGTYPVHIIARNARGDRTERTTSLTMH